MVIKFSNHFVTKWLLYSSFLVSVTIKIVSLGDFNVKIMSNLFAYVHMYSFEDTFVYQQRNNNHLLNMCVIIATTTTTG